MKRISIFIVLLFMVSAVFGQQRITDPDEARSIFEEVDERRKSIQTETATMEMVITDPRGRTRTRTLRTWSQNNGDDSKSLIIFSEPGNIRGTGFLNINEDENRTQRLYLPAVGRIQTISSSERGDRFMGSDFTYEDLGDQDPDDYEFEWLETSETHYTVRASKPESDQYAFVEFDILKGKYTLETARYFNNNGDLIKRLEAEEFEEIADQLWSPSKMTMYDLREDRKTELTWSDRSVNNDIPDWRFTERGLRRGI